MGWQKPGLDKWSLPVTVLIGEDTLRFGELRDGLSGASPRAIALVLKSLENLGWVKRSIVCEYPLAAGYCLEKAARNMLPALRKMCDVIKTGDPRIVVTKKWR
jgi:DNA-binding HxlR family transcriptional regulator